jgi:pimeloyl-ACP methyl ester carboxylesterase
MPDNTETAPARHLALRDGRSLVYRTWGPPGGRPLYFLHGFPGSSLQATLIATRAVAAGVRLVALDRPGFGGSTPQPGRTIRGIAVDVEQLADHLGDARFGVLGVSCGGAYALACAHEIPQRIDYTGLVAGIGPLDVAGIRDAQHRALKLLFALAHLHPWLAAPLLLPDRLLFRSDPARAVRLLAGMLTKPDRALLAADPGIAAAFGASLADAYRQGLGGPLLEAHLIASPRGFELRDITIPVHVYQGRDDRNVPPAMGRYLAGQLPRGELHYYREEGHLSILVNRIGDCLAQFGVSRQAR